MTRLLLAVVGSIFIALLATPRSILAVAANPAITLLYNNDLNVNTAGEHKSALLLTPRSYTAAVQACEQLSETVLPVNKTFFETDLAPLLQYQVFQGAYESEQQFWVASNGQLCQVVDVQGHVATSGACARELPVLCTQSAGPSVSPQAKFQTIVSSNNLKLIGYRDQRSFRFLGIPYANKAERFTYPTAYSGSSAINATQFASPCVQSGVPNSSEDCLFLNIFTPIIPQGTLPKKSLKAVMFWIHGGAFTSGEGSDPLFDGGSLTSRGDVVLVTVNYRLSTLGFLALEDGKTNGNFGLADQIAALEWVREHIIAFGGDPDRITIFGQSAGAASVRALLGSPKAIGKFAAAVPMSNLAGSDYASTYSFYYTIPEEVSVAANPILAATGCNSTADPLACLRAYDAQALVNLPVVARFVVVEGMYVTSNQLPLDGSRPVANVHTMMGFMRDDGAAFISYPTSANLSSFLAQNGLPLSVVSNESLFPLPSGSDPILDVFNTSARVTTDVEFRCLDQATAFSALKHNLFKSIWFYEFNRSYQTLGFDPNFPHCEAPIDAAHPNGDPSQEYFKCHSGELYYVFGNLPVDRPFRDDIDLPFMQMMVDIWTSFARTYDPNPDPAYLASRKYTAVAEQLAKQSKWLPVTASTVKTTPLRELQWPSFMTKFQEGDQCAFLGFPITFFG